MSPKWNGTIPMSPEQWFQVADNPIQRNTEEHAEQAVKAHLSEPHMMHRFTNAARLPDGHLIKLDGHTRGLLWHTGRLEPPQEVSVTTWLCETLHQVEELYRTFDNRKAASTARDDAYGAMRKNNVVFDTPMLQRRQFLSAMKYAYTICHGGRLSSDPQDLEKGVQFFREDLLKLDELRPTPSRFGQGILAAALITTHRYGSYALKFWGPYSRDEGWKAPKEVDAVEALARELAKQKQGREFGSQATDDIMRRALSCFEAWRKDETYFLYKKGGVRVNRNENTAGYRQRAIQADLGRVI